MKVRKNILCSCSALAIFLYKRCLYCTSFLLCRIPSKSVIYNTYVYIFSNTLSTTVHKGGSFYRRISICCWALTSFLYKRCLHCTSFLLCRIPTWHPTKVFRSSPFGKGFWTNLVSAGVFQREYQLWHLCLKVIHPKYKQLITSQKFNIPISIDFSKGQLIWKGNFSVFNSSKKQTWKF